MTYNSTYYKHRKEPAWGGIFDVESASQRKLVLHLLQQYISADILRRYKEVKEVKQPYRTIVRGKMSISRISPDWR
jgi:hypothetical protein